MKLDNLKFINLLPQFMVGDAAIQGLSEGTDTIIKDLSAKAELLKTWNRISQMSDAELDALAWELNIKWYYMAKDLETKRRVVKQSGLVYARLGSVWAVEELIQTFFGSGYVKEWFEYGGTHHRFKIISTNPDMAFDRLEEFLTLLEIVKRKSAWLDAIVISLAGSANFYIGVGNREYSHETYICTW